MLGVTKLQRMAQRREHGPLLEAVVRNGRPLPLSARARLGAVENLGPAAVGLALQRAVELSYAPSLELEALLSALEAEVGGHDGDVGSAGLAVSLAGVADLLGLVRGGWCDSPDLASRAERLAASVAGRMMGRLGFRGDAVDAAIVVWQLGAKQEHLGAAGLEVVDAAEGVLDEGALADHPACQEILSHRPARARPRGRDRRAA